MTINNIKNHACCMLLTLVSGISWAQPQAEAEYNFLYQIPMWIEATPTVLPEQSNHSIVPNSHDTAQRSWLDQQHLGIRDWVDDVAHQIDTWFGEPQPEQRASATLRILIDQRWNKYDDYDINPRIRGKIELPTLEKRLSIVFGDDSLDDQLANQVNISTESTLLNENQEFDSKQRREDNSSLALRWSSFNQNLPFETDFDLGVRSGDDIYARLKAEKEWQLEHDFHFHLEQIYRYGLDSEHYLRTNVELSHRAPHQAQLYNQFALIHADASQDDLNWSNHLFRQHQFFQGHRFNYGLYTSGFYTDDHLRLNQWGPFVSWRQPVLRDWFYVQTDLNYYNKHREDRSHYLAGLLRLEVLF